jgi:TP901 family phage tail tape measure protein
MASDINIRIGASITDLQKKLKKAEYSLKRSGNKMKSLGTDLMMGLSAPIGLFGVAAIKAAGDFESSMNGMKAVTAGGIDMFDELEATAKRLGATTQFSATEAAQGMEMLGRNGLTAQQILDGAAEASLTLAAATGTDLGNAANIATDAMAQFNLEASQLANTADIITGATVISKFGIDDFQGAMAQAGGVAGAVGVSFDDFATTVSAISPSFNSGADAGTSLKTMLTRLVPESKNAADMMRQLGIITADGSNQFFDAEGNMKSMSEVAGILQTAFAGLSEEQRIQASKTLFGTDAMRAGLKLAETGSEVFDQLKTSIEGTSATDVAATRLEGFDGAVLRLKSSFEALQLAIADSGLKEMATMLIESLTGIFLRLAELNPETLRLITIIGGVVAAIPPMIFAFGAAKVAMGHAMSRRLPLQTQPPYPLRGFEYLQQNHLSE